MAKKPAPKKKAAAAAKKPVAKPKPAKKAAPKKAPAKKAAPPAKPKPKAKGSAARVPPPKPASKKASPAKSAAVKPTLKRTAPKKPIAPPPPKPTPKAPDVPKPPPPPHDEPYPDRPVQAPEVPLSVSAQGSPGLASRGNTQPANILVLVTCGGWPVTNLSEDDFSIMEHFEVPGQTAPFSNNVVSFRNVGSGAYLIQVKPINHSPWMPGHHLAQVMVSSPDYRQGQTAVKLIVR